MATSQNNSRDLTKKDEAHFSNNYSMGASIEGRTACHQIVVCKGTVVRDAIDPRIWWRTFIGP
jgi:hypothetical protein